MRGMEGEGGRKWREVGLYTGVLSLFSVCLYGMEVDVVKSNARALIDEVMPERRLDHLDVLDEDILSFVDRPWNWTSIASRIPSCTAGQIEL